MCTSITFACEIIKWFHIYEHAFVWCFHSILPIGTHCARDISSNCSQTQCILHMNYWLHYISKGGDEQNILLMSKRFPLSCNNTYQPSTETINSVILALIWTLCSRICKLISIVIEILQNDVSWVLCIIYSVFSMKTLLWHLPNRLGYDIIYFLINLQDLSKKCASEIAGICSVRFNREASQMLLILE